MRKLRGERRVRENRYSSKTQILDSLLPKEDGGNTPNDKNGPIASLPSDDDEEDDTSRN